jgi:undecaprenyl-diphosphatase
VFWIDRRVLEVLAARRVSALDRLASGASRLDKAGIAVLVMVAVIATALVARSQWRAIVTVTLAVLAAQVLATGLKGVIAEPRPPRGLMLVPAQGWAMPSTHAAYSAAAAVALVLAVHWASGGWRWAGAAVLAAAAVTVGFLMVYAGVHWLTDVLFGWALGGAVGVGTNAFTRFAATRPLVEEREEH